ncbi:cupin domain-containing protein [Chengkuizengella sp. SCS-71B]|uniref:cupin domain-containing protein n=1 Tax=Chengkuizengella sp. SCS-71B TaxID=3115290 RepID=UPI0032C21C82
MLKTGVWEEVDEGVSRKIHPPGKHIMMMEVRFQKGAVGALHSHPHEQYTYCLKGKMEFTIDGEKKVLQQGDTLHIPSNALHGVIALESSILLDTFYPLREDLLELEND